MGSGIAVCMNSLSDINLSSVYLYSPVDVVYFPVFVCDHVFVLPGRIVRNYSFGSYQRHHRPSPPTTQQVTQESSGTVGIVLTAITLAMMETERKSPQQAIHTIKNINLELKVSSYVCNHVRHQVLWFYYYVCYWIYLTLLI